MCKQGLMGLLLAIGLSACGGSPSDEQSKARAAPDTEATTLRDAAQAPLDRATSVQQTMDAQGAKLEAETEAAYGAGQDEESNPNPDDDEDQGDDGEIPDEGDEPPMPDEGDQGDDDEDDPDEGDE